MGSPSIRSSCRRSSTCRRARRAQERYDDSVAAWADAPAVANRDRAARHGSDEAGGTAAGNPDAGAAKLAAALATPANYVEFSFEAEAGRPYRLWLRGRAERDYWGNDSVFVQFSGSVNAGGVPVWRIGSTDSTAVNLEDAANAGIAGWGWQDNGYGTGALGPAVMFAAAGPQTIRIQTREDGFRIDHVVLSAERYLNTAPGALKNDTTTLR